jgi:hypothetical protein
MATGIERTEKRMARSFICGPFFLSGVIAVQIAASCPANLHEITG